MGVMICNRATIWPACLPAKGNTDAGFVGAILLKAQLIPVSNSVCNRAMGAFGHITRNMICAANQDLGADTCQGDSGGPLISRGGAGGYSLVGITSWGLGCAVPGTYGVYSRVTELVDWVVQQFGFTGI